MCGEYEPRRGRKGQRRKIIRRTLDSHPTPTPQPTPCRLWQGVTSAGYGVRTDGHTRMHRWVIEQVGVDQFGTAWDPSLHVLHQCDQPLCYRYNHLWLDTHAKNMTDAANKGRMSNQNTDRTHCANGHEYTEENTYHDTRRGWRQCIICRTIQTEAATQRRKGNTMNTTNITTVNTDAQEGA